jgi:hypothetical protein
LRLLGQCLCDCHVWLFDHGSECAPLEHVGLVGAPHRRHWRGHAFHAVFKLSPAHLFRHVFGEDYLEVLLAHLDDAEAELKLDVFVVDVDQVLNRLVDNVKGATDDIDAHLASAGDRHGVRVDRLEALLEDGLLTAGR